MVSNAKYSILLLLAAWVLAVIGLVDVNMRGLANVVDARGYGGSIDPVGGEHIVVDYELEARAEISTVTITDYDCEGTSAPPEQPSPTEVTPAAPKPPATPTQTYPVPTTFIITVSQPQTTPETHAGYTSPTDLVTSFGPSGTEVSVTVSVCPGCPSVTPSGTVPSVTPSPSNTGHPVESPSGAGSSGEGVSVTTSLCEGCPSSATSGVESPTTSSGQQVTPEPSSSETVAATSSSEHTPSLTPVPNNASPLKGMHLAGLGVAALHLLM